MPNRAFAYALAAGVTAAGALFQPAQAADSADRKFFESVAGEWVGPGEIVAGKYKGTKFTCTFTGSTPGAKVGMTLDGGCRVGVFTQKLTASVSQGGREGYTGTFQDGADGKGLDIISGNVIDNQKVVFAINRKQLRGAMLARLPDENTMNVTVSVKVDKQMVPVIGMNLRRVDSGTVGSVAQE